MRLRQLFESKQSVGFIFGRFNPPHKGHRAAWEMLSQNDAWYVGTNTSTQGPKDPLPYNIKIKAMEAIWPEVTKHITPSQSWLTLASEIYKKHGDVELKIYTDEEWVIKTINQYNGKEGPHGLYNFSKITPVATPRLSSATALRTAVAAGDKKAFADAAGVPADTPIDGVPFFDLVAEYLGQYKKENRTNEDRHPNEKPRGPETKPTMPAGTVKVDVSDVYDWYKLGQHISDLEGLGKHDFGQGPPASIISFGSEELEHEYINNLKKLGLTTTDIDPKDPRQPKSIPRQKTDPTYNVENVADVKNPVAHENNSGQSYLLQLERDNRAGMLILHILDKSTGKRTEVRGKMGYETNGYDPEDKLHQLLDKVGKSASVSDLMNGNVVSINPRHPDGASAKAATDKAYNENFADSKVKYANPQFDVEWEEAERYPEFVKIGKAAWIELANKGKAVTIKSAKGINNTDAADADSFKSLDKDKQARALAQLKSGNVEMPIVAVYPDGWKELIGGNTRLTAMLAQDGKATVWVFKVPDEVAELAENFADGKNPGRKGLAKRSGVNTKASVSSLRKTAKNSSGEKQRMAHWLANMKAGRKKAAKK